MNKIKNIINNKFNIPQKRGAAMTIAVLFFIIISIAIVIGSVSPVVNDLKSGQELIKSKLSYFTAEAGGEDAFYRLKKGKQISSPEVTTLNGGSSSATVVNVSSNEKEITTVGDVQSNIRNTRISVTTGVGSDFAYGAQVGEGGLVMNNNSKIKGTGGVAGNVYSNGPISGASGATVTGDATVATSVTEDVQARSTVCNANQVIAQTNPEIDFAQSFVPSDNKPLYKVGLYIKKVGSPSSPTIRIVADNSGVPNTTTLSSASLQVGLVGTNYAWIETTFSTPANLVNGQTYWIVLDGSQNGSNYFVWCRDSNNGLGNGVGKYRQVWNSGSAWSAAITGDLDFKTYLGGGPGIIDNVNINGNARSNTITNSTIGGTAYCQTGSGNNKSCDISQADPSPLNMPLSQANIDQWKDDAAAGGTITGNCGDSGVAGCNIPSGNTLSLGPKKITGNLTLTNNRTLNITGVLYIQGNIDISNNGIIKCDVSYGPDSCVVVADGWINAHNNAVFSGSGQAGSYVLFVSTIEGCNGGSQTGSCTTGNSGVNLENNLTGAIFYTTTSMVNMSNNAELKSVVGYKLQLANNAEIEYEQGVADTTFSSGPGGGWNVKSWNEVQ